MITEQSSPCSISRECLTRKSVKSCAFRKERYVRGSFTRIGSCKITWTNFEKILFRKPGKDGRIQRQRNRETSSVEALRTTAARLLRKFPARIPSPAAR